MQHKILIVENRNCIFRLVKHIPSLRSYNILAANSVEGAFTILARHDIDVIVSDDNLSTMSGMEFLTSARQKYPDAIQMILTGDTNFKSAIRAINEGKIYRLFAKPCNAMDLAITIHCVLHKKKYLKRLMNVRPKDRNEILYPSKIFMEKPCLAKAENRI